MKATLPILPIRDPDLVVFPGNFCEVEVGREFSVNAINVAKNNEINIIVGLQTDKDVDEPVAKDFLGQCTEAEIKSVLKAGAKDEPHLRVILVGVRRAHLKIVGLTEGEEQYLQGEIEYVQEEEVEITDDIKEQVKVLYDTISEHLPSIALKKKETPKNSQDLAAFLDDIAGQLQVDKQGIVSREKLLDLLHIPSPAERLKRLVAMVTELSKNTEVLISNDPQQQGEDPMQAEIRRLAEKLQKSGMPEENMKIAQQEMRRLSMTPPNGAEFQVMFNYLETLASLPWGKSTEDSLDIEKGKEILDRDHFGLKKPKERILEFLAVKKLAPERKGSILCFIGPPGTGKTSLGKSIAEAMGREFIRTSLGGVHDEAEIRGHRRTYVGAMPGRIIQLIKKVGVNNPVFMLDELDKLGRDFRGDPGSALLEVLDPEQNHSFNDNYLGMSFDLSNVFFIATINTRGNIQPALLDRMEIIKLPGYSPHDKLQIAKKHLIPKQKEEKGLKDHEIAFSKNAINKIIEEYTSEAGVRSLERECGSVFRKVAVQVASKKKPPAIIKTDMIHKYLGPSKIFTQQAIEEPSVGVATGLAWAVSGGSLLFVESALVKGKGKIVLTGNLGKVLKESASAAYTWIRSNADKFGLSPEKFAENNVHIHFPAGATPKDGPSAGIAIAASILSALTDRPIRNDVGMTGEISLRGRVLPIGGLLEKTLAAHRASLSEVVFPIRNKCDLEEVPNDVKNSIKLTPVSNLEEALDIIMMGTNGSVDKKPMGKVNSGEESLINLEG